MPQYFMLKNTSTKIQQNNSNNMKAKSNLVVGSSRRQLGSSLPQGRSSGMADRSAGGEDALNRMVEQYPPVRARTNLFSRCYSQHFRSLLHSLHIMREGSGS